MPLTERAGRFGDIGLFDLLPNELRFQIYEEILIKRKADGGTGKIYILNNRRNAYNNFKVMTSILRTCRTFYYEGYDVFLRNTFVFDLNLCFGNFRMCRRNQSRPRIEPFWILSKARAVEIWMHPEFDDVPPWERIANDLEFPYSSPFKRESIRMWPPGYGPGGYWDEKATHAGLARSYNKFGGRSEKIIRELRRNTNLKSLHLIMEQKWASSSMWSQARENALIEDISRPLEPFRAVRNAKKVNVSISAYRRPDTGHRPKSARREYVRRLIEDMQGGTGEVDFTITHDLWRRDEV